MKLDFAFSFLFSSALIQLEMKNQGEDAFKPEIYGDAIILERRIAESSSTTLLKDCYGLDELFLFFIYLKE